jgi:hypothetical protein
LAGLALGAAAQQAGDTGSAPAAAEARQGDAAPAAPQGLGLGSLPFFPVPEIDVAPLSGVTLGVIPVFLSNNAQGQIEQILAPDIIHSQYFGWGARWRIFRNPSDDEKFHLVAGAKQEIEREFDLQYDLGLRRDAPCSWSLHAMFDRSGTGRFWGFGNASSLQSQASFIDSQARAEATAALNLSRAWQIAYRMRVDSVDIEPNWLDSLPSIQSRFPGINGLDVQAEWQQMLTATYDSRDSLTVPRSGRRWVGFVGFSRSALEGTNSYSFLGFDGTELIPAGSGLTVAAHAGVRYMPDDQSAPFWALSSLGGDRSVIGEALPLRAFPPGRFVDRNVAGASLEARTWVRSFHFFDTDLKLELAPFVEAGKVYATLSESPFTRAHVGAGMGFRFVAMPFVVGYLDVGYGSEGAVVFSGIDYPF